MRSNSLNPNNAAYSHSMNNRSNQLNPNNDAYWQSRGYDGTPDEEAGVSISGDDADDDYPGGEAYYHEALGSSLDITPIDTRDAYDFDAPATRRDQTSFGATSAPTYRAPPAPLRRAAPSPVVSAPLPVARETPEATGTSTWSPLASVVMTGLKGLVGGAALLWLALAAFVRSRR